MFECSFRVLLSATSSNQHMNLGIKVLTTLYGIWNLDFFRSFYPDICLPMDTLSILALDYAIAIYPLLLTFLSYFFIHLHDRNFRLLVILWKPIKYVLTLFYTNWNSQASVIDAYVTFFLLSYMKMLSVSFDLLVPTNLYLMKSKVHHLVLYFDGSKEYFGKEHRPYAIFAVVFMLIFNIFPAIFFFVYQFSWFQKILNHLPL